MQSLPTFQHQPDGRPRAGHAQLAAHIGQMSFHRRRGDAELVGDLVRLTMPGDA